MLARLSLIAMAFILAVVFPMAGFAGTYAHSSASTGMDDQGYGAVDQGSINQGYGAVDQGSLDQGDQGYGAADQVNTFPYGYGGEQSYNATYGAIDHYDGHVTMYNRNTNTLVVSGNEGQKTFDISRAAINGTLRDNEPVSVSYSAQNGQMVASSVQVAPRTSMNMNNEVRSQARVTDHGTEASATTR